MTVGATGQVKAYDYRKPRRQHYDWKYNAKPYNAKPYDYNGKYNAKPGRQDDAKPGRQDDAKPGRQDDYYNRNKEPERKVGWIDKLKSLFGSEGGTSKLTNLAASFPGATARDVVIGLERKTIGELIVAISELVGLLGADEALKILEHTRTSIIGELDKMCSQRGWSLFDEVAKQCVPLVEEAIKNAKV